MIDESTRRQVYELTLDDLSQCAIWEFALDEEDVEGQDEATVRPRLDLNAYDPEQDDVGLAVVRARLRCADGTELIGHVTPSRAEAEMGYMQPVVVTPSGHVPLWLGLQREDAQEQIAGLYAQLGKDADCVFPLEFAAAVEAPGSHASGRTEGFGYLDSDFAPHFTR
jgi:hypothetical protein